MNRKGIAVSAAVLALLLSGCFSPSSGDPGCLSSESATSSPSEENSVSASSPSSSSGSTERLPTFWLDNPVYVELELEDHLGRPTTYRLNPLLDGNPAGDVHYANSDPSVLSVDKDGLITAVATGTALITANYGPDPSLSDEIEVKVSESAVEIVVPDEIYIGVGETFALAPVLLPATSSDERDYRFLSSDVATATVGTDGTIRGVAGGMCEILVFCVSNYLQKSVLVTVNPQLGDFSYRQVATAADGSPEYEITSYCGESDYFTLPNYYRDGTIVSIGEGAFEGRSDISEISINGSFLREIKDRAFAGSEGLNVRYYYYMGDEPPLARIGEEAFAGVDWPLVGSNMSFCTVPSGVVEIGRGAFYGLEHDIYLDLDVSSEVDEGAIVPADSIMVYARPESRPEGWSPEYASSPATVVYGVESVCDEDDVFEYYVTGGSSPYAVIYDAFSPDSILECPASIGGYPVKGIGTRLLFSYFTYLPASVSEIVSFANQWGGEMGEIYVEEGSPLEGGIPAFIDPEKMHFGCLSCLEDEDENVYVEMKDGLGERYLTLIGSNKRYNEIPSYEIPSSFSGLPVKAVGRRAFQGYSTMRELIVSDEVILIGDLAFNQTRLEMLTLGKNLERIEEKTFYGSISCPAIFVPESVSYVGASAFSSSSGTSFFFGSDVLPETGDEHSFYKENAKQSFTFSCQGVVADGDGRLYVIKEAGGSLYATLFSLVLGTGIEYIPETVAYDGNDVSVTTARDGIFEELLESGDGGEWHFLVLPDAMSDFGYPKDPGPYDSFNVYSATRKVRFLYSGPAQNEFLSFFDCGIASFGGEIVLYEGAYFASIEEGGEKYAAFLGLEKSGGDHVLPASIPFDGGELSLLEAAPGSGTVSSFSSLSFPSSLRRLSRNCFREASTGTVSFASSIEIGSHAFAWAELDGLSFSSFPFETSEDAFSTLTVDDVLGIPRGSTVADGSSLAWTVLQARSAPLLAFEDQLSDAYESNYGFPVTIGYRGTVFYEGEIGYALVGSASNPHLIAFGSYGMNYSEIRILPEVETESGTFPVRGIAHQGFVNAFGVKIFLPSSIDFDSLSSPFPSLSFSLIYVDKDYADGDAGIDGLAPGGHNAIVYGYRDGAIFTTDDGLSYAITENGLYLVSASGASEATCIAVPSSILCPDGKEREVYGIADEAFSILPNLEEVRLPSSVRLLGGNLFFGSPNVRRFYLPSGLIHAFDGGIEGLTIILSDGTFGEGVDWVGEAYPGCESMAGFTGIEFESGGIVYGLFEKYSFTVAVALYPLEPLDGLTIASRVEYDGANYDVADVALSFVRVYEGMGKITIYLEGTIVNGIPEGEGNVIFVGF